MSWLVIFCIIGLIGAVGMAMTIFGSGESNASGDPPARALGGLIVVVCLLLNVAWSGFQMIHFVDEREVGVVRTFGKITGTIDKGMAFTAPWQSVEKWSVRTQIVEPDTTCANGSKKCMNAGSVDIQDVYVQGVVNLNVNKNDVFVLARGPGQNYKETIVLNRMYQVVKATISQYRAEEILAKREEIRGKIRDALRIELQEYSIAVDDFLIVDIDFTDSYRAAIDQKVLANQQAALAVNTVAIKEAEAKQAEASALGVANSQRIAAQGRADSVLFEARAQAEANNLLTQSLSPNVLQLEAIKKLNPNIQWGIMPSGNVTVTNFSDLFKAPAPAR